MRQLSAQVSVVPVIVKGDTLNPSQVFELKAAVLQELAQAKITIFGFGLTSDELIDLAQSETPGAVPYVVSSPKYAPPTVAIGKLNEFDILKRSLLYNFIDDLRQLSAER